LSDFPSNPPHRKRCKRFNTPGDAHYLTFSCFHRKPFLSKDRSRQWLVEAVNAAREKHAFDLWAYVIMPEHAHLLIHPRNAEYDISPILNAVKQSVAKRAVAYVRKSAPAFLAQLADVSPSGEVTYRFWQRGGGYDRNLRTPADVWEKIDYTHWNPVKRGLCERTEDWLWSSAVDHLGKQTGPLSIDFHSLPRRRSEFDSRHSACPPPPCSASKF
jgi:putative transposase